MVFLGKIRSRFSKIYEDHISDADLLVLRHMCRDEEDRRIFDKSNLFSSVDLHVNRHGCEADHMILMGAIKPHYFAGFSGGGKTLVPGLADRRFIIRNHLLKIHVNSETGKIRGNLLREEIREATGLIPNVFIVNVVLGGGSRVSHIVAGDVRKAYETGTAHARRNGEVEVEKSDVVIVSDGYPVSQSVKQFKKVVGPALKMVKTNGVVVAVGECGQGIGSGSKINDFVYKLYLRNKMPENVDLFLVSDLYEEEVQLTGMFRYAETLEDAVGTAIKKLGPNVTVNVLPYGSHVIPKD